MKFCFFGDVSGAIKGNTPGGGELQTYMLAKALAIDGHEVVIIDPYADEDITTPEGVKLICVPAWKKGIKGLRWFKYRIPALYKIFASQNADYYYMMMRSFVHLLPYVVSRKNGAKFILAIASDVDVLGHRIRFKYSYKTNFKLLRYLTENLPSDMVFDFLLKKADYVTLQHAGQKFQFRGSRSKQVIFSNIIELDKLPVAANPSKDYFIHVGSLTMLKGADNLLKLINSIDESITIMVVGSPKGEKPQEIYKELGKKKNVILKGWKEQKEAIKLISNAKALINTSYFEGFPNIFLEAWGTGVPVISLNVNPGNIFNEYELGVFCNGDLKKMKEAIETFDKVDIPKEKLISYVRMHHDFSTAAKRFVASIS